MLLFRTGARLNGIWGPETPLVQAEQVCCWGFQSHARAHTQMYIAVYTLQSHNPTTLNVAAAQIGHLELGHCILILLSNFQSVKRRFYDYDRMREHHQRKIRRLSVMLLSPALVSSIVHLISKEPEYNNANLLSTLLHWRLLILIILMSLLI